MSDEQLSVTRYSWVDGIVPDPEGTYVTYDDYRALQAKVEEMKAECTGCEEYKKLQATLAVCAEQLRLANIDQCNTEARLGTLQAALEQIAHEALGHSDKVRCLQRLDWIREHAQQALRGEE